MIDRAAGTVAAAGGATGLAVLVQLVDQVPAEMGAAGVVAVVAGWLVWYMVQPMRAELREILAEVKALGLTAEGNRIRIGALDEWIRELRARAQTFRHDDPPRPDSPA